MLGSSKEVRRDSKLDMLSFWLIAAAQFMEAAIKPIVMIDLYNVMEDYCASARVYRRFRKGDCSEIVKDAFLCPGWIIVRIWCGPNEMRRRLST
jgi:hypothetical protein